MTADQKVTLAAPAKINLGLEILGKRADGFHEIRTVMAMVGLCDTLTVADRAIIVSSPVEGVVEDDNLIARALSAFRTRAARSPEISWAVEKRIPMAAGLGGASSDAAATLRAANQMCADPLDDRELHELAAGIGSDVPFFLGGPAAVASGRGTDLVTIEAPRLSLLLVVPRVVLRDKTRHLYSLLQSSDFSDGSRIDEVVDAVEHGHTPSHLMLQNAFSRALCTHVPRIERLQMVLTREIGLPWGLSGAGPSHYVLAPPGEHDGVRRHLDSRFPAWIETFSTTTLETNPELSIESTVCV